MRNNLVTRLRADFRRHRMGVRGAPRVGEVVSDLVDSATPDFSTDLASSALDGWTADSVDATDADSGDAVITSDVASRAASTPGKAPPSTASGAVLKAIQAALMKLGYDLGAAYGADGKMGPYTRAAITKFKQDHGIVPGNGQVTAPFRSALNTAAANPSAPGASAAGSPLAQKAGWLVLGLAASVAVFVVLKKWHWIKV